MAGKKTARKMLQIEMEDGRYFQIPLLEIAKDWALHRPDRGDVGSYEEYSEAFDKIVTAAMADDELLIQWYLTDMKPEDIRNRVKLVYQGQFPPFEMSDVEDVHVVEEDDDGF